jgi:signal transduction histidine kinase
VGGIGVSHRGSLRSGRGLVLALVVGATVALLPAAGVVVGEHAAFLPAFFAVVLFCDLLSGALLWHRFRATGSHLSLLAATAYAWSVLIVVPHVLVFPGVLTPGGLLGATPPSAPWLWTAWHTGFPLLLAVGGVLSRRPPVPRHRRSRLASAAAAGTCLAAAGATWAATAGANLLPTIIVAGDYSALARTIGPWTIAVNVLAVGVLLSIGRGVVGLDRWLVVAAAASLGDVVLTLVAEQRFTVGWYSARAMSLVVASVVLLSLVQELARLTDAAAQARDEALQASEDKSQFLATVSHEIRTPLNGVVGILDLLAVSDVPEKAQAHVATARRSAESLVALLDDVLQLAEGQARELSLHPRPFHLHDLVNDAQAVFAARASTKGLLLQSSCAADGPALLGDPDRLRQVLLNLVGNAVKFTSAGHVHVSAEVRVEGLRAHVRVAVDDTGPGMSAQERDCVLERYVQGAAGDRDGGTGLGLAISSDIVRLMGGRLRIDSTPNEGSRFTLDVELPVIARPVTPPVRGELRVLVVDDDPVNRLVLGLLLEQLGAVITELPDASQLESHAAGVDLVLLDEQLPGLDGVSALRALRASGAAHPRVVACTGNADPAKHAAWRAAGAEAVLVKPIRLDQLQTLLTAADLPIGAV